MNITEIAEFPDYRITKEGIIYGKFGKILHQYKKVGYNYVFLYKNNKRYVKSVHRLVATTFIPNPKKLPEVNHKDENTTNNKAENLEWCDRLYNANYGTLKERQRKRMLEHNPFKNHKHSEETKRKIRDKKLGQPSKRKREIFINGIKYESVTEAMRILNISTKKLYKLIKE